MATAARDSGNRFVEPREGPEMFKRLFYAVLGFWLLKKYVLPHFNGERDEAVAEEQ